MTNARFKVYSNLFLYDDLIKNGHYIVTERLLSEDIFGFPVSQESIISLEEFMGMLVLDGYPSDIISISDEIQNIRNNE